MSNYYPRMLFRPDGTTSRADSRDEMLAKRAQGWRARLLPGETPEDIGDVPEARPALIERPLSHVTDTVVDEARKKPGRPKKIAEE